MDGVNDEGHRMRLQDTRVVVLGGTSGIGFAAAAAAAAEGAAVVVASSREDRVEGALARLPDSAEGRVVDLRDEAAIRALFAEVGAFDHLVYTAGEALSLAPIDGTDVAAARSYLDIRVWGAFAAVKYAAPNLRPGGSVVLTSGTAGPRPQAGWSLGALVCSGMEGMARALAVELAPLRVNVVRPGIVRTELWEPLGATAREALYADAAAGLPVARVGEPGDVAATIVHLMAAGYTTGSVATVDGGGLLV